MKDTSTLYAVSAFNYTPRYPGIFIIYGLGKPESLAKAKDDILAQVKNIKKYGITEEELESAKNIIISNYIDSLETVGGLARTASQGEFILSDPSFFEKYVANVEKLESAEIATVAEKYLNENNLTVSYLVPGSNMTGSGKVAVLESKNSQNAKATKDILPNGMRLILKEDHRIPKISFVCAFLGGLRSETKLTNGVSNLTASMLLSGTKRKAEDKIKPFIESRGGKISTFSGRNTFGISGEFLVKNLTDGIDVLEDIIKNSTFPKNEMDKEKQKIFAAIKAQDDDIYRTGFLKLDENLFKNYPYGMRVLGEIDSVKRITREDVEKFYSSHRIPSNMVMTLVGDFEADKMAAEIKKRFLGIRETTSSPAIPGPTALSGVKSINIKMKRAQSLVIAGFRSAVFKNQDRFALEVLSSVLSGENGRLYHAIRNDLGISYALGTFSTPGIDTGLFASYVATDEASAKKAKDVLLKELGKVTSGVISDEELASAKTELTGRQKIALQTQYALAYQMTLDEIYGVGYDAYLKYDKSISGISKEVLTQAAKKYIDLQNFVTVEILGEEN